MNNTEYSNTPPPQPYGSPPPQFQQYASQHQTYPQQPSQQQSSYQQEHGIATHAQHPTNPISQPIMHNPQDFKPPPQAHAISPAPTRPQSTQVLSATSVPQHSHSHAQHWTPPNGPTQAWSTSMCGCFEDWKSCCLGMWCPCMLYARTHRRLRTDPSELDSGFSHCTSTAWLWCCCGGFLFSARQRSEIRYRYNLQGGECGDLWRHCCCGPCTMCQEEREIVSKEKAKKNLDAQSVGGYEKQAGMQYAAH